MVNDNDNNEKEGQNQDENKEEDDIVMETKSLNNLEYKINFDIRGVIDQWVGYQNSALEGIGLIPGS